MTNGALYVAYGEAARQEAKRSAKTLGEHNPGLPIAIISDKPIAKYQHISFREPGPGARWAKLQMDKLTPFDKTMYIDADTRIKDSLMGGFDILNDGWDMVITPSTRQRQDVLGHLSDKDKELTLETLGREPLNLQAGLLFFRKCKAIHSLFDLWRQEWQRFQDQDQGALLRALQQQPVKVWLLSWLWNSHNGEIMAHEFGAAR